MLLLENATAWVNLHKLYNSLSLFIKSLCNLPTYGWKGGGLSQISVHDHSPFPHHHLFIYSQKERLASSPLWVLPIFFIFFCNEWNVLHWSFIYKTPNKYKWVSPSSYRKGCFPLQPQCPQAGKGLWGQGQASQASFLSLLLRRFSGRLGLGALVPPPDKCPQLGSSCIPQISGHQPPVAIEHLACGLSTLWHVGV